MGLEWASLLPVWTISLSFIFSLARNTLNANSSSRVVMAGNQPGWHRFPMGQFCIIWKDESFDEIIYQNIVLWRTLICFNQLSRRCQLGVMDRKPWIWAAYIMSGADIFWCLASGVQIRISLSKKECGAGHSVSFLGIQVLQRTSYWSHLRAQSVESLVFCLLSYTGN